MAKTKNKLICSSSTISGLEKLINQYFYSTTYQVFPDMTIVNSKGIFDKGFCKKAKNKYYFYMY